METRHAPLPSSRRTAPHRTPRHVTAPCEPPRARLRAPQLISRLKSHKRGFGEEMAARLMSKMIASILYCHERNVCHRDVKLDNFVYEGDDEDGEPVTIAKRVLVDGRGLSLPYTRPHAFTPHLSCCKASLLPRKRPRELLQVSSRKPQVK